MENKEVLEQIYRENYEAAIRYVKQYNLIETKNALIRALEAIIKLIEISRDSDRSKYIAKGEGIKQLIEQVNAKLEGSDEDEKVPEKPPIMPEVSLEEALEELNALEGLHEVKKIILENVNFIKILKEREKHGLEVPQYSHHMVFAGNPGTGKTTVARIMGKIYRALGVISNGHLVEASRMDLVGGYVGQTAKLTRQIVKKSIGGILLIENVNTLIPKENFGNDFGPEAIDTLLAEMEKHSDLIVIASGYENLINDFINFNPGLRSKFKNYTSFPDYNNEEMFGIFNKMCEKNKYVLTPEAREMIKTKLNDLYEHRGPNFANARDARRLFQKIVENQAARLLKTPNRSVEILMQILPEDIPQR